jgi:alanyl-tRNA synthetase
VGSRALRDYMHLDRITRDLCRSLSLGLVDLPRHVERAQEDISGLRKQVRTLQERTVEIEAAELLLGARRVAGARVVRILFGGRSLEEVKLLAAKVAANPHAIAVFGTKGAIPQIVLHRSVDLRIDLGGIIRQVLPLIDGKGGGSPVQAQGGGSRPDALEHALDQAVLKIADALNH